MMMDYRYHNQFLPIPEVDYRQQGGQFFPGGGNVNQRLTRLERQFDRLDRQVNQLDRRVDRIERRLGIRQESEF